MINRRYLFILSLSWGLFFALLFARILYIKPDGLYVGHEFLWSDWTLHISLANIFAHKPFHTWFAYHPLYADGKLTYAFLTNFISAMLMRLGLSLSLAFILPSILYSFVLLFGMHVFFTVLLGSEKKSLLATCLFFLSSGLGFLRFFADFSRNPSLDLILHPLARYSGWPAYGWGSGNFIVGHLLPQRAFLLGMMLAVWAMAGILFVLLDKPASEKQKQKILLGSALLTGILPIAHMHSLIAMVILLGPAFLWNWRRWKILAYFIVPAGILSLTLYALFISGGIENKHFFSIHIGYTANGFFDWLKFWFLAWGFMIPTALFGFFLIRHEKSTLKVFYASAFLLFALTNIVYFQPLSWDNSKLFLWTYFCLSGLASIALVQLWQKKIASKIFVGALFFSLTFTGVLELILVQEVDRNSYRLESTEEIALAEQIRDNTLPLDRFLTARIHNSPIMITAARPILMGYPGWVLNFGFLYAETSHDIEEIYRGAPNALDLIRKHKLSYIVVGPYERNEFHPDMSFLQKFPIAFQSANYYVFDVREKR